MNLNTPGPIGYFAAVALAFAWNATFLAAPVLTTSLAEFTVWWMAVFAFSFVYGLPFALIGALGVHVLCSRIHAQWMHVVAAGLAGLAAGYVLAVLMDTGLLAVSAGAAAALGRLAVVPSVHRRRRRFASPAPLRVP